MEIRRHSLESVRVRLTASDGSAFIMDVYDNRLEFFGDENKAGHSNTKPVVMGSDEIWKWIKLEGGRVALKDRADVKRGRQRKSAESTRSGQSMPKFGPSA